MSEFNLRNNCDIVSLNLLNVQRLSSGKLEFTTQLPTDTGMSAETRDDLYRDASLVTVHL